MVELCPSPKPKDDNLLADHVEVTMGPNYKSANETRASNSLWMFTAAWLTFTTLMAIAGMIMAAWATSRVRHMPVMQTIVMVQSPQEAYDRGYNLVGNMYQGTGYWVANPTPMANPRSDHGVAAFNGSMYVFGGQSYNPNNLSEARVLNNVTRYNMYFGLVDNMEPMPEPRYRFGFAVVPELGQLFIFGGFNGIEGVSGEVTNKTMVYTFATNTWSFGPEMTTARGDIAGAAAGGMVYAVGGYELTNYNALATAEVLNPATGKWTRIPDMIFTRGDLGAIGVNDTTVYVMGGITNIDLLPDGTCADPDWYVCHPWTPSMESYDPTTNQWTRRADMAHARGDFAVDTLANGHILVAGGENSYEGPGYDQAHLVAQSWVEEYVTELDIWVPKAAMFEPRFRFDMASEGGNFMYAFGGAPTCLAKDDGSDNCNQQVSSSILAYYDNTYPNIWAAAT